MRFSSGDAALHGFSLFSRAPLTVIGVTLLISFVLALNLGAAMWPWAIAFNDLHISGADHIAFDADIDWPEEAGPAVMAGFALILVFGLLAELMIRPAILRPLTRDRFGGWFLGLKLGMDELRVLITALFVAVVFGALFGGLILGAAILGSAIGLTASALDAPGFVTALLGVFLIMGLIGSFIYLGIRLSPMIAATVGEKRFVLFEAWNMTRGKFWQIFGAYFIALAMVFAVAILLYIVAFAVIISGVAGLAAMGWEPFIEGPIDGYWTFGALGALAVILGFVAMVTQLPMIGVGAYVYRHWAAQRDKAAAA